MVYVVGLILIQGEDATSIEKVSRWENLLMEMNSRLQIGELKNHEKENDYFCSNACNGYPNCECKQICRPCEEICGACSNHFEFKRCSPDKPCECKPGIRSCEGICGCN